MQASSPWPDVIISSQHDLTQVFPNTGSLPATEFHVDLPHSSQHVAHDPFSNITSGANAAGNGKLAMPFAANMHGEHTSNAGKAAVQE